MSKASKIKEIQEEKGCSLQEARRIFERENLREKLHELKAEVSRPTGTYGLQSAMKDLIDIVEEILDGHD